MNTPAVRKKRRAHIQRIIGVTLILLAVLIWNVPGQAKAAGTATLASGPDVNVLLKKLVPAHSINAFNSTEDTVIKRIVWDEDEAKYEGYVDIASENSDYPIYANYSGSTLYLYTDADGIALGSSSGQIFQNFTALEDASGFLDHVTDTSNATNMYSMFAGCRSLQELDLSSFNDTSNVTGFASMFDGCSALKKIEFGNGFSTSGAVYLTKMFNGLSSLEEIDLSGFDTSKVTDANSMFNGTNNSLKKIDLSTFDLRKVDDSDQNLFFDLDDFKALEEVVTPKNSFKNHAMRLPYDDFRVVIEDGSLGDETYERIPAGSELRTVTLRRSADDPTESPTPSSTPEVTASPTTEPTAVPTTAPTAVPTATPVRTPTAVPTSTPTSTASASASPTRTPTSSARTSASPTPPLVTPVRSTTPRPTATTTARTTATPSSNPNATTAPTSNGGSDNNNSNNNSGNYTYYNPYAVVNNGRKGNAYDMPKTGDGDAFRLILVAALFVMGCIILISSIPKRSPDHKI